MNTEDEEQTRWVEHYVNRDGTLRKKYGMSIYDYRQMVEDQGNACKICRKSFSSEYLENREIKSPAVDHCHKTGNVRGILCYACNAYLGHIKDDAGAALRMLAYLN
jgi:hypothetical protein